MEIESAKVISNTPLTAAYRLLILEAPRIAPQVRPGQFVQVRVPQLDAAVLRRPFSVFKTEGARLTLLYKSVGQGTRSMARLQADDNLNLLGPLGNGFPPINPESYPLLVAGGYGIAALYLLAQSAPRQGVIFMGGSCAKNILCLQDFAQIGWPIRIATEDGSQGEKGLVTEVLKAWLQQQSEQRALEFFACGPMPMLRAVAQLAQSGGWRAWLSLDRHQGCGVGACLACVQKIKKPDAAPPQPADWQWARTCIEGPVFESREIIWDDNEP
ncbi:MAG: dihydroorotate dehydrogenase electron transfer subunit [Lentisphaerae bacterium]|nr:dihydroorotate dehydrogenase electron transfer subunit [Lentisphaerota bacterium]